MVDIEHITQTLLEFADNLTPWKPQAGWGSHPSVSFPKEIVGARMRSTKGMFAPKTAEVIRMLIRFYKTLVSLAIDMDLTEYEQKGSLITCVGITVRILKRLIYPFFLDTSRNLVKVVRELRDALYALTTVTSEHDINFDMLELNTQYAEIPFNTLKLAQKSGATFVLSNSFSESINSFFKSARKLLTRLDIKHAGVLGYAHMYPETIAPASALNDRLEGWIEYWSGRVMPISIVDFMLLLNKTVLMYIGTRALLQRRDKIAEVGRDFVKETERKQMYDKWRPEKLGRMLLFTRPDCDACESLLNSEYWSRWVSDIPNMKPVPVQVDSKRGIRLNDMCFIEFVPSIIFDLTYIHSIDVENLEDYEDYKRMELMTKDYPFRPVNYREDKDVRSLLVDTHLKHNVGKKAIGNVIHKIQSGGRIDTEIRAYKPKPGRNDVRELLGHSELEKKL